MIILLVATLVFALLLRRESALYPRMVVTLAVLDISICALAAVTTWYAVLLIFP